METSLMLYLFPELVLPLEEAGDGAARSIPFDSLKQKWAWTEREWSRVTKDTGVGNPYKASAEKGEKYFRYVTGEFSKMLVDLASTKREEAYR